MQQVSEVIEDELKVFEKKFAQEVKSTAPLLNTILSYVIKRKGKQMRPMFVLLSAKLNGGITESSYRAASLVELLHTATLVHDDVVDESMERRGFFSINALWKNKAAVLIGDYLLSKGLLLSINSDEFMQLKILSEAVKKMSEGELLQMEKSRKLNIDEATYFNIIDGKTASLVEAACAVGAYSAQNDMEAAQTMKKFGNLVGLCFQLKDDLFDYTKNNNQIGKPTGNDIREKKITLPLIYTLEKALATDRKAIINIVKSHNQNKEKINWVIDKVHAYGGIDYTIQKMNTLKTEAINILQQYPNSNVRNALEYLVNFTTTRTK